MPSSGGPRLDVSYGGMATVAATMTSAAGSLAALGAAPPVHAPLAPDEVSTTAAARLSEHGGVLSSRALDGAAVLTAAAQAVVAVSANMAEIDAANAASLAVGGAPAAAGGGAATPAAVKSNAVAPDTPIAPMAPRPGEATAGLIEAGSSSAGATFHTACRAYQGAFEACAVAARTAESAVAAGITGQRAKWKEMQEPMQWYFPYLPELVGDGPVNFVLGKGSGPASVDSALVRLGLSAVSDDARKQISGEVRRAARQARRDLTDAEFGEIVAGLAK